MNAAFTSSNQNKSFSTRLYRLTQQHKHWFFVAPALIILLTVVIYPIIFSTGVSLFRVTFASLSRPFVGLQNFERMLSNDDFLQVTYNTLFYVVFFGFRFFHFGIWRCSAAPPRDRGQGPTTLDLDHSNHHGADRGRLDVELDA